MPRESEARHGQHFLRSPELCSQLVEAAGVGRRDLVLDLGAGTGALTCPLAARAHRVVAVERDPGLAARLRRRCAGLRNVEVREDDALATALPRDPFVVVANLPFFAAWGILCRLLDDPYARLQRADVVVEWGLAVARARPARASLADALWAPWYEFVLSRRLDPRVFEPPPAAAAAVLSIRSRPRPLIDPSHASEYRRFVAACHRNPQAPMKRLLRGSLGARRWRSFASGFGLRSEARPVDLDPWQWPALFRVRDR